MLLCKRNATTNKSKILIIIQSLGDFHLKYKEFNEYNQKNYKRPIKNFNGPYIKSNPDIKIFDITPNDEYIVLGTDGLWDLMGSKDVAEIIKSNPN